MNTKDVIIKNIAYTYNLPKWDATNRVNFTTEELGIDPLLITPAQAEEIEHCIAADLKAGK